MRRNQSNGKNNANGYTNSRDGLVRLSGYITPEEKESWIEMMERAAQIEDIRHPDNGTFFSRIISNKLRLDKASMSEYVKTHVKAPPKRRREQTPART